jgi:hypothetical protein
MADPVLVDFRKVQVVFFSTSNLPEDVFINNWYFRNDDPLGNPNQAIKNVLDTFYTQPAANGVLVGAQFSTLVKAAFEYRIYDLGQPPPRQRMVVAGAPLPPRSGTAYPAEVALVGSFYAGVNQPRKRGRHYLGPLSAGLSDGGADPRPAENIRVGIADRYRNVANTSQNVTWVQVSQVAGVASVVTNGWVDNAFDTQRRRGVKTSARSIWAQ